MTSNTLGLSTQAGVFRKFLLRRNDPKFQPFIREILERDAYTCRFCGFCSKNFQEVINLDHNYDHNARSNMATACIFCAQCFFLESVGLYDFGGGRLIYLPELSQIQLNALTHVLFCSISVPTPYSHSASEIYTMLKARQAPVEQSLGEGMSAPSFLGRMLLDHQSSREQCDALLKDLRLLPLKEQFKKQIEVWSKELPPDLLATQGAVITAH